VGQFDRGRVYFSANLGFVTVPALTENMDLSPSLSN